MTPLISVIVPIYKIDQYLGICIESIINQTYRNLEIILVDDGSPDRCPDICDLYARKDGRIMVIHKTNGGLVSARKAGLQTAKGEYVGYVDGDDWVGTTFYESMMDRLLETQSDLVVAGHSRDLFLTSTRIPSHIPAGYYVDERLHALRQNMLSYGEFFRSGISTYVWNKVFRKDLLLKHQNAVDNTITIGEDAAVVYPYIMDCQKVCVIDNFDYHYRQREDSMLKKSASFTAETMGLRKLDQHLRRLTIQLADSHRLIEQIDDFMLSICIIRSGGIIKKFSNEYSPYVCDFEGKNIIIWSAGTFGQQLYNRIKENEHCHVVGWLDNDYCEYRRCCMDVDPIDKIDSLEFDYVLLATVDEAVARFVREKLVWRGISEEKILTVQCPRERRTYLLQQYLSI